MRIQDHISIHPEDASNISYWTKKWGISIRQLNDAILDTGSVNISDIRHHLKRQSLHDSIVFGIWHVIKEKIKPIH